MASRRASNSIECPQSMASRLLFFMFKRLIARTRSYERGLAGFFLALFFFIPIASSVADDGSVEVIEVQGDRASLLSDQLVAKNISAIDVSDSWQVNNTTAQWLVKTPGVSLNGQGGLFQSYSIRGFSRARIRTEVDGIPIITDRRAGNAVSFLPAMLVNRIDIQKGPSSTLYGSEAMGGVVNLITSDFGQNNFSASIQNNNQLGALSAACGNEQTQLALAYRHSEQGEAANGDPLNNGFEQYAGVFKQQLQLDDLSVKFSWMPSVGKDIGKSSSLYPTRRVVDYPSEVHSLTQASVELDKQWLVKLFHHYQNWDTDTLRVDERRNVTEYQSHTLGGLGLFKVNWFGGHGRVGIDWLSRKGVDIRETELSLNGETNFTQHVIDAKQDNYALLSDIHWSFEQYSITAGLRYDLIKQSQFINQQNRSDHKFNASVLANFPLSKGASLQTEVATGFRFPTLSELYFEGETPRGSTLGNAGLKPEESVGLQVMWVQPISTSLSTKVESYYYQLDNYIERYNINDDLRSYRNLDKAKIYGAEALVDWQVSSMLFMQLSFQWQRGEDNQGNTLSDLHPMTFSHHSQWYWREFSVENSLTWRHRQSDTSSQESKRNGHLLWDISVGRTFSSGATVSFFIKNLLDRLAYSTADEDAAFIQGRSIGIKGKWLF